MKFRFYITDTLDGSVKGTDSEKVANEAALSEDNFVVDSQEGTWLQSDLDSVPVAEQTTYVLS